MTGNRSQFKNFVEKFIGIYNKRTRQKMETIHVTFDELHQTMASVRISSGPEPIMMTLDHSSSSLSPHCLMMSAQISSGLAPQCLKMMFRQNSSSLVLHQMMSGQISSGLTPQCLMMFGQNRTSLVLHQMMHLLASLQAPFLKDKKGVRFSALYLQQKRNLLILDHSHQQLFWNTLTHDAKTGVYSFQVDEHWLTLSADLLWKALNVTSADSAHPFESPPAGKTDITFTRRRVPSNWLMKMKFNRLLNLIWMIMSTIYNKTTRKLPVVEVKGKGSATDRWIIASQDETTGPFVHPEDATSTKMVRETLSHADAESGGNSEKVGSNSEQSHVALAGPNPEHMHDVFLATNYPKVHESLKHTTKEHVHLENPPSSSRTLSSMKNLEDS
ncbi:hypothetical protein Tco_0788947 [Tanacetum coccineum]